MPNCVNIIPPKRTKDTEYHIPTHKQDSPSPSRLSLLLNQGIADYAIKLRSTTHDISVRYNPFLLRFPSSFTYIAQIFYSYGSIFCKSFLSIQLSPQLTQQGQINAFTVFSDYPVFLQNNFL